MNDFWFKRSSTNCGIKVVSCFSLLFDRTKPHMLIQESGAFFWCFSISRIKNWRFFSYIFYIDHIYWSYIIFFWCLVDCKAKTTTLCFLKVTRNIVSHMNSLIIQTLFMKHQSFSGDSLAFSQDFRIRTLMFSKYRLPYISAKRLTMQLEGWNNSH